MLLVGEKRFLKRVPPEDYVKLKNEVGKRLKISDRTYKNFKVTPTIGADIAVRTENAGTYGKSGADAALAEAAARGAAWFSASESARRPAAGLAAAPCPAFPEAMAGDRQAGALHRRAEG